MITRAGENVEKVTRKLEYGDPDLLDRIRRLVRAIHGTADPDLEQDAFLRVLLAFRKLERISSPEGLIRKIVRDTVVDRWRARRREEPAGGVDDIVEDRCEEPGLEERIDRERIRQRIEDAILGLGCDIRGPVYLFYIENYPIRVIVRIFGKSPSAIKMALHRGRRQLERLFLRVAANPDKKFGNRASFRRR